MFWFKKIHHHFSGDNNRIRFNVLQTMFGEVECCNINYVQSVQRRWKRSLPNGSLRAIGAPSSSVDGENSRFLGRTLERVSTSP